MDEFLSKLFSSDFMPHGSCYFWQPQIVWLHAISDSLIAFSYYLIPVVLVYFVRKRRDLPFNWMFVLFGVFIFACGTTHLMEVWTLWHGTYRLSGVIKAFTAAASLATLVLLIPLIPQALALPSPAQMRDANEKLEQEIGERRRAERALQEAHAELELRVRQRTAELAKANDELREEIVQRQRAEEELQALQVDLSHVARVSTMGEMAASIAHEVNQPLTAIVTNGNAATRWLAGTKPNLDEAIDAVNRIIKEGNRASQIIKEIRQFVKKTPPQKTSLQINDLIRDTLALVQRQMEKNQVRLQMELAPQLPAVLAERVQLQQVLLNLIINGVEAMNAVTERAREMRIQSQWEQEPGRVLVAVRDSGPGLKPAILERLFDAFFTTKEHGMGMGLSIARSIITAHGGAIWATANPDQGATFQFTVPATV